MIKPSTITQWLMQPAKFSDKDRKEAAAIIKTYPYFVPTRYIEAAEHHKKQPFAPAMFNMMHLYIGNWLLFHEFLQSPAGNPSVAKAALITEEEELLSDDTIDEMEYPEEVMIEDDFDFGNLEEIKEEELFAADETVEQGIAAEILEEEEPFGLILDEVKTEEKVISKTAERPALAKEEQPESKKATEPAEEIQPAKTTKKEEPLIPKKEAKKEKTIDEIPFYQNRKADSLIQPIYTEDYFLHQGLHVSEEIPQEIDQQKQEDKSLMVVMSFSEWLMHFKTKGEREKEEQQDQKALKTMWQKEKLAAALEEENEEIPETVFEMAVNSITKEEDLASEPLAEIMVKQGKYDKAIDMYRKLSLRNPQKKTYFARKIEELQKDKES